MLAGPLGFSVLVVVAFGVVSVVHCLVVLLVVLVSTSVDVSAHGAPAFWLRNDPNR